MKGLRNFREVDRAIVTFNTSFDLSSVYNWNVKQIFVFLVAEYESPSNRRNEVVVWDHVAQTPRDAVVAAQAADGLLLVGARHADHAERADAHDAS